MEEQLVSRSDLTFVAEDGYFIVEFGKVQKIQIRPPEATKTQDNTKSQQDCEPRKANI